MEGRATEVRNIAVDTEISTHTTSITVGKFTQVSCLRFKLGRYECMSEIIVVHFQTNTVTKTITAKPKMKKKRSVWQAEEDHALAKRQAAACPALPTHLQLGDQPFKDYEWNWIVENACAAAIPTALPTPKTRTETRLIGCVGLLKCEFSSMLTFELQCNIAAPLFAMSRRRRLRGPFRESETFSVHQSRLV